MEITQRLLIANGFCLNNTKYRENGEAEEITDMRIVKHTRGIEKTRTVTVEKPVLTGANDENGNPTYIMEVVEELETYIESEEYEVEEEYVKEVIIHKAPDFVEEYLKPFYEVDYLDKDGIVQQIKVDNLRKVEKLSVIYHETKYFGIVLDTKDGFKIQLKTDQLVIPPTIEEYTELSWENFKVIYNKYTGQNLMY